MRPAESGALTAAGKYFLLKYSILGLVDLKLAKEKVTFWQSLRADTIWIGDGFHLVLNGICGSTFGGGV